MSKEIKRIGVLTSGGDAPGMNASIRAIVRTCSFHGVECVGIFRGFQGLIDADFETLGPRDVHYILNKGGTILKTARCNDFKTTQGRQTAYNNLKQAQIDALIIIGGDGSFTGGMVLSEEYDLPIMGIPGTIDNDIFGTSHTIGFDTACNTVVDVVDKIRDTASSHKRLFFVEVMGRDAGHIALNAGIGAGAEEIIVPEENLGMERLLESLARSKKSGKSSSIVIVAEGEKLGKNVFELGEYVEQNLPDYDVRVSVLGHMQRGAPSCFDRVLASRLSVKAVETLLEGKSNLMVGLLNDAVALTPLKKAVKGHSPIDPELLRVSDIITI